MLTYEKFLALISKSSYILYGTESKILKPGEMYHVRAMKYNPEFYIFHPDDVETVRELVKPIKLIHLRDEPKESVVNRIKDIIDDSMQL